VRHEISLYRVEPCSVAIDGAVDVATVRERFFEGVPNSDPPIEWSPWQLRPTTTAGRTFLHRLEFGCFEPQGWSVVVHTFTLQTSWARVSSDVAHAPDANRPSNEHLTINP
jgi:hypothetical protein